MRVVGGHARSRKLHGPRGSATRPMADRVKEALFSILENALSARRPAGLGPASIGDSELWNGVIAADVFAGTGSLGIETLSRGAQHVDFVEIDERARRVIRANLESTGLSARANVLDWSAEQFLAGLDQQYNTYHLMMLDPPYSVSDNVGDWLHALGRTERVADDGLVAVGHSSRTVFRDRYGKLEVTARKSYGGPALTVYRNTKATDDSAPHVSQETPMALRRSQ